PRSTPFAYTTLFRSLGDRAVWFEPAFHHATKDLPAQRGNGKRSFFFYARPHHPRNLFYLGLEVIQACVQRGVLDPEEWEFNFVGDRKSTRLNSSHVK